MFTSPSLHQETLATHALLKQKYATLSLADILTVGITWTHAKIVSQTPNLPSHYAFLLNWHYSNPLTNLSSLNLYNRTDIYNARPRAEFLRKIQPKFNLSSPLSLEHLEAVSYEAYEYATVLYAIKCYVIANDLHPLYKGLQPATQQIKAFFAMYNSAHSISNTEATHHGLIMSLRNNVDPTTMNTLMYLVGSALKVKN